MKIYGERCIYTYNACFVHVGDLNNRHTRRGPKCTNGAGGGLHVVGGTWVSYPFSVRGWMLIRGRGLGVGVGGPRPKILETDHNCAQIRLHHRQHYDLI